jgi:hypothetical protein
MKDGRFTVAERFCTLATYVGRSLTPLSERAVRVVCETEQDLIDAFVAAQHAASILRVSTQTKDIIDNSFTVELGA